jgi:hypothetical protein
VSLRASAAPAGGARARAPWDGDRARFEENVTRRARQFGLKALVDLLLSRGYAREQILFQAILYGAKANIVEAIEFRMVPLPAVVVTVNLGVLGDGTLLPAYMLREIERARDPERFYDFLRFFDHCLIENFLRAVWPEDDPMVYGDYALVQRALLRMSGFSSVSSLHWLAQAFFPELRVRVDRKAYEDTNPSFAVQMGTSTLDGAGVLGRSYDAVSQGFRIALVAEEETDDRGRSWAAIVRGRLETRMLPVLAPFQLPLSVCLEVLLHASWVQLEADRRAPRGYLGYDRIRGQPDDGHRVVIWRGVTGVGPANEP